MRFPILTPCLTLCAVFALAFASSSTADAGEIILGRDTSGADAYSSTSAGEFKVTSFTGLGTTPQMSAAAALSGGVFQTFCVERNEYVSSGTTYRWVLNTAAVSGGIGGGSPDYLGEETAYLYTEFWNGTLDGYDYSLGETTRAASATQLQNAIWYLEGEKTSLSSTSQAWDWVLDAQTAVQDGSWSGIGNVRVLNLYSTAADGSLVHNQDQLILVPLPAAAWMGLPFLAGLVLTRRRRALRAA